MENTEKEIDKIEEAKKILIEAEAAELKECSEKYLKFLEGLQKEYNVRLNVEYRGLNNQCEVFSYFTKVK